MMRRAALTALVIAAVATGCTGNAEEGLEVAGDAQDIAAQSDLQQAGVVASNFMGVNGSLTGFTAAEAESLEPSVDWADGGAAAEGVVSIRGAAADSVALVTMSDGGNVLCLGITAGGQSQGQSDAKSAAECTGGW